MDSAVLLRSVGVFERDDPGGHGEGKDAAITACRRCAVLR